MTEYETFASGEAARMRLEKRVAELEAREKQLEEVVRKGFRAFAEADQAKDAALKRVEEMETALRLILPQAKAWAHEHPVGANQANVDHAAALSGSVKP